jgi:hypothetical protein
MRVCVWFVRVALASTATAASWGGTTAEGALWLCAARKQIVPGPFLSEVEVRRTLLAKRSAARARRAAAEAQAGAGDHSERSSPAPSASAAAADSQLLEVFERVMSRWDAPSVSSADGGGDDGGGDTRLHSSSDAMQPSQQSAADRSKPLAATPREQRASPRGSRQWAASQD